MNNIVIIVWATAQESLKYYLKSHQYTKHIMIN